MTKPINPATMTWKQRRRRVRAKLRVALADHARAVREMAALARRNEYPLDAGLRVRELAQHVAILREMELDVATPKAWARRLAQLSRTA